MSGEAVPVALEQRLADQLTYYKVEHGLAAFAPKGWSCRAWFGANGSFLVVTPKRLAPPYYPLPNITGPAVTINSWDGSSSGRFHVAIVSAQLFSVVGAEFSARVRQEHLIPDASFNANHYPDDDVKYLSDRFVAYTTPANHTGLGTDDMLDMSSLPIRGLVLLNLEDEMNSLTEIRVRLPSNLNAITDAVLLLETSCVQSPRGCRSVR